MIFIHENILDHRRGLCLVPRKHLQRASCGGKKGELTAAWRNFTHKQGISQKKMIGILERYGFNVKILVTYKT